MSKLNRFIACATLLALLTGCSGFRTARAPWDESPDVDGVMVKTVEDGDRIRVTTSGGISTEGLFSGTEDSTLLLSGLGESPRIVRIDLHDITDVEVYGQRTGESFAVALGVMAGVMYFLNGHFNGE